jgi:hypothetical protein
LAAKLSREIKSRTAKMVSRIQQLFNKKKLTLVMCLVQSVGLAIWANSAQAAENIAVLDLIAKNGLTQA